MTPPAPHPPDPDAEPRGEPTAPGGRIRVAHLADLHIGSPLRGLDDYPGAPEIDPERAPYAALEALVRRVAEGPYDAVLVAGDVFDRAHADATALAAFQDALGRFHDAGLVTAVISGNHDAETPLPQKLHLPPSVRWLGAHAPETVHWDHLGIAVHGQSIVEADDRRDIAAGYPRRIRGAFNIGLLHTSLHGAWSRKICAPTAVRTLEDADYDYWALGHVHHRMRPPGSLFAGYPGNTHGRGPAERGGRGFTDLLIGAGGPAVREADTAPVRYESLRPRGAATAEEDIRARFAAVPPPTGPDGRSGAVVWTLEGPGGEDLLRLARGLARPEFMVCRAPTETRGAG
ncbi:DNA repair exonuclease [Streptomyces sp. G-G2]|uniref:metallophosphoesterase family protein n=1 Tax=Streptomyces sp. G-G2 TaxID=3046201 RepID=UPI0024BA4031|nr:DNA repair exonuclease [Streptomyces sp. G-G2]MDJ0383084.1 DNA repair exonuclease [Streptomyces sp. G-G2]